MIKSRLSNARVWIPLVLLALVAVILLLGNRLAVRSSSPLSLIADDYRSGGGGGLQRWAAQLRFAVHPLQGPAWEVNRELGGLGNCLITAGNDPWSPFREEVDQQRWNEIERWIEAGNALIVMTSDVKSLPKPLTERFRNDSAQKPSSHFDQPNNDRFSLEREELVKATTWWGGELSIAKVGPRLKSCPKEWLLAGTESGAVLIRRSLGRGHIYLMLDRIAWANAGLDEADNAATLARILRDEVGAHGVLAIDHYRHGRGRIESFATFLTSLPGAHAFLLMTCIAGVLWFWRHQPRLGPADEFRQEERRTAQEYIEAVAAVNQRARAAPLALEAVANRVKYLLHRRRHLTPRAAELIREAERHIQAQARPTAPRAEIDLVGQLLQVRRELHGTRSDS